MAIRAASIWRLVIQAGSKACRPYWPNVTSVPPLAPAPHSDRGVPYGTWCVWALTFLLTPFSRVPFPLRGVLRRGRSQFDTNTSIGGLCLRYAVINIGTQRVKRYRSFVMPSGGQCLHRQAVRYLRSYAFGSARQVR